MIRYSINGKVLKTRPFESWAGLKSQRYLLAKLNGVKEKEVDVFLVPEKDQEERSVKNE